MRGLERAFLRIKLCFGIVSVLSLRKLAIQCVLYLLLHLIQIIELLIAGDVCGITYEEFKSILATEELLAGFMLIFYCHCAKDLFHFLPRKGGLLRPALHFQPYSREIGNKGYGEDR
jgi:hypothetical protein